MLIASAAIFRIGTSLGGGFSRFIASTSVFSWTSASGFAGAASASASASALPVTQPKEHAVPSRAASHAAGPTSAPTDTPGQASAASAASAAVASKQPDLGACQGFTVYLQVFGPEWREEARSLRQPWRSELGASVPPIEDVLASSRSRGSAAPAAVAQPEVRLPFGRNDSSKPAIAARRCADALQLELTERYQTVQQWTIPARLGPRPRVIEVWLPPRAASHPPSAPASTPPPPR